MRLFCPFMHAATLAVMVSIAAAQLPPQRLQIPGALLVTQAKPVPFRTRAHLVPDSSPPIPSLRQRGRPIPNAIPVPLPPQQQAPIRPVVEEAEESPASTPQPPSSSSTFDDEVNKLGLSVLTSAVRQAVDLEEDAPNTPPPRHHQQQLAFRPERPVPVLRENIRDNTVVLQRPSVFRQEQRENIPVRPQLRQEPAPQSVRQRQHLPQPVQIPVARQPQPRVSQQQQQYQQQQQPTPRQQIHYTDEGVVRGGGSRTRKPPVQILRKYRTDNPDGSITWGYENEDGSFKEETLGNDCTVKGKYGYVDPDGVRREYAYEAGHKCDEPEELEDELVLQGKQPQPQARRPQPRPAYATQPQY